MALNKTTTNTLADSAITSDKIENGAITNAKISDATTISITKTPINALPPTITSLDTSVIDPTTGATVTITGTRFVSIPDVKFLNTTTGARITASSVGFTSSTTITATFPSGQTAGVYKVIVENPNGLSVISSATITYSIAPAWSTAAGSLGSFEEGDSVSASLLAYDDDSTAVSSYSLVSGSLPSGITLSGDSSIGALTGTAPSVDADTQYSFTIRATDNESQTSDRAFTMDITNWGVFNALRYDDGSTDYLNRTSSTPTSTTTCTFSAWIKRSDVSGADNGIFTAKVDVNNYFIIAFASNKFRVQAVSGGSVFTDIVSNQLFRDASAWYHIVASIDSAQGTSSDRVKLYVNGNQITSLQNTTYPSSSADMKLGGTHEVGRREDGGNYFDGYMAETLFIDGQQLTPSSFGETDATSGIWVPKKISGLTFGTNGFHLKFSNSGALGTDSSGNSNTFTVNNLTSIDQVTDTPQNNFATLNPLAAFENDGTTYFNGNYTISDGNLNASSSGNAGAWGHSFSTFGVSSGKWYWEVEADSISNSTHVGVSQLFTSGYFQNHTSSRNINLINGSSTGGAGSGAYNLSAFSGGDILMIALDMDNGKVYFGKNGTWGGSGDPATNTNPCFTGLDTTSEYFAGFDLAYTGSFLWNFGNPPFTISSGNSDANGYGNFEYAVPSGYYALCTKNLAQYG